MREENKDFFAKMTVEVDEKEDKEGWSLGDFLATILRTMKLLWDVLLVFAIGGLLFGAGIAIGYATSLFNETETPDPDPIGSTSAKYFERFKDFLLRWKHHF